MTQKINILVSAVGGPTAIGVLSGLKQLDNVNIYGTSLKVNVPGKEMCKKVFPVSEVILKKMYFLEIQDIIEKNSIDIFFPTLQDEIPLFYGKEKELNTYIALPKSDYYAALTDKLNLYRLLEKYKLDKFVPHYHSFTNNHELEKIIKNEFKKEGIFVKNVSGHGGLGAVRLVNRTSFLNAIEKNQENVFWWRDYLDTSIKCPRLAMDYLEGVEYSVDIFAIKGTSQAIIPRKRKRTSNGIVIEGQLEENTEIIDASEKITKLLNITGFYNLQFISSNNSIKLIDLNARFCGSQIMSLGGDVNFPELVINYLLKNKTLKVNPKWTTKMVRYWESYFYYD